MKKISLLLLLLPLLFSSASAQTHIKKDTLYYFIDTLNTPLNDKLFDEKIVGGAEFVTIKLKVLRLDTEPFFNLFLFMRKKIKKEDIKKLNPVALSSLINLLVSDQRTFNEKYLLFFIESDGEKYTVNKAFFQPVETTSAN